MKVYLDTSAFGKLFYKERDTDALEKFLMNIDANISISELAVTEAISAFYKKYRTKELDIDTLKDILFDIENSISEIEVLKIDYLVFYEANNLLKKYAGNHNLRTLDALQLSCFKIYSEKEDLFISFDIKLNEIVVLESMNLVNFNL